MTVAAPDPTEDYQCFQCTATWQRLISLTHTLWASLAPHPKEQSEKKPSVETEDIDVTQ